MKPIFIHGAARSGSTYIWKKFRDQPQYRSYFQTLHPDLAWARPVGKLLPAGIAAARVNVRTEYLHHPNLDRAYFHEYPLRWLRGGVAHFDPVLSYERYWLDEHAKDEALRTYIQSLISFAERHGQTAVLKFTRSLLRSGWLKTNIPSTNILLLRRPIDVWNSVYAVGAGPIGSLLFAISRNRHHPFLAHLAASHDIPDYRDDKNEEFPSALDRYGEYCRRHRAALYPLFYEFHTFTCLYNVAHVDCVMDLNALTESAAVRQSVTERLARFGIDLSLDDCRVPLSTDLSDQERAWVADEPERRAAVLERLPQRMLIPRETLRQLAPCLSSYFQAALAEFAI